MHGVRRDRSQLSAELKAQRKEREARKLALYLQTERRFFELQKGDTLTLDALDATTRLLNINPELYTAWNYRRRILAHLFEHGKDHMEIATDEGDAYSQASLLTGDLELTMQALQMHPKVYWIWNHRKWCLQHVPTDEDDLARKGIRKWQRELALIDKMLEQDARNFHGWNYRRYILSQVAVPSDLAAAVDVAPFPQSLVHDLHKLSPALRAHQLQLAHAEVEYTLVKIEKNFSNFSAWHQRSLFLPAVWVAENLDQGAQRKARDEEFELVRQAMFVDPDDQSVWTYHEWLVSLDSSKDVLDRETASIKELLEIEPESRWCMQTLAHYYRMYDEPDKDAQAQLMLEQLVKIDADRKGRYVDIVQEIKTGSNR